MSIKALYIPSSDSDFWIESGGVYETTEYVSSSAGAGDAGKPIVLDGSGLLPSSMIDDSAIDHNSLLNTHNLTTDIDHDLLTNYVVTEHIDWTGDVSTTYTIDSANYDEASLISGTRDYTGLIHYDNTVNTDLTAISSANSDTLVTKEYVDAVAYGIPKVKEEVDTATTTYLSNNSSTSSMDAYAGSDTITGTLTTTDTFTVDGVTYSSSDNGTRVLVKDEGDASGLGGAANGIYTISISGTALTLTRASDFDNSPTGEIYNGVWIPKVVQGTTYTDTEWIISSVGTGTDNLHTIGTDVITFSDHTPSTSYSAGNGIDLTANTISVDIFDTDSGLYFTGTGTDELAVEWATTFTIDGADDLAFKASSVASTTNGEGASIVGVEDASAYYTGTDLETVLNELEAQIGGATSSTFGFAEDNVLADDDAVYAALDKLDLKWGDLASTATGEGAALVGIEDAGSYTDETTVEGAIQHIYATMNTIGAEYTADEALSAGDLVYVSAADNVSKLPLTNSSDDLPIGLAGSTVADTGAVNVLSNDTILAGVLTGATAGDKYYWNGTTISTTKPTGSGSHVWRVGVAKNATDLHVQVEFVSVRA